MSLSCASLISALILVSPEPPDASCTLEGSLLLEGPDGVAYAPPFAEVYVNTRNLRSDTAARHTMFQRASGTERQQFDPRVLVVQVGDTVDFKNEDTQPHEVHADQGVNLFNVKKENSKELTYSKLFLETGVSHIGCQIHSNMSAIILAVPNAFHARVSEKGMWKISGLPKRELEVVFWEAGGEKVKQKLTPCVSPPTQVVLPGSARRATSPYGGKFQ